MLGRMAETDFTSVIDTNRNGAFGVTRRAVRGMLREGHGVSGTTGRGGTVTAAALGRYPTFSSLSAH